MATNPQPQGPNAPDGRMDVFSRYKTVKGKRLDARDYGLVAWHFRVTAEQNAAYWAKRKKPSN